MMGSKVIHDLIAATARIRELVVKDSRVEALDHAFLGGLGLHIDGGKYHLGHVRDPPRIHHIMPN